MNLNQSKNSQNLLVDMLSEWKSVNCERSIPTIMTSTHRHLQQDYQNFNKFSNQQFYGQSQRPHYQANITNKHEHEIPRKSSKRVSNNTLTKLVYNATNQMLQNDQETSRNLKNLSVDVDKARPSTSKVVNEYYMTANSPQDIDDYIASNTNTNTNVNPNIDLNTNNNETIPVNSNRIKTTVIASSKVENLEGLSSSDSLLEYEGDENDATPLTNFHEPSKSDAYKYSDEGQVDSPILKDIFSSLVQEIVHLAGSLDESHQDLTPLEDYSNVLSENVSTSSIEQLNPKMKSYAQQSMKEKLIEGLGIPRTVTGSYTDLHKFIDHYNEDAEKLLSMPKHANSSRLSLSSISTTESFSAY